MSIFVLYELRYNWPTKTAQFRLKLRICEGEPIIGELTAEPNDK
jgi:hypothetical protein